MANYIEKRRRRFYAVLSVPLALRPLFDGKAKFVQSLQTESRTTAERRALPIIAAWKAEFDTDLPPIVVPLLMLPQKPMPEGEAERSPEALALSSQVPAACSPVSCAV